MGGRVTGNTAQGALTKLQEWHAFGCTETYLSCPLICRPWTCLPSSGPCSHVTGVVTCGLLGLTQPCFSHIPPAGHCAVLWPGVPRASR